MYYLCITSVYLILNPSAFFVYLLFHLDSAKNLGKFVLRKKTHAKFNIIVLSLNIKQGGNACIGMIYVPSCHLTHMTTRSLLIIINQSDNDIPKRLLTGLSHKINKDLLIFCLLIFLLYIQLIKLNIVLTIWEFHLLIYLIILLLSTLVYWLSTMMYSILGKFYSLFKIYHCLFLLDSLQKAFR